MVGEHEEDDTGAMTLCHFEAIVEVHGAVLSWVAGAESRVCGKARAAIW